MSLPVDVLFSIVTDVAQDTRNAAYVVNAILGIGGSVVVPELGEMFGLGRVGTVVHLLRGLRAQWQVKFGRRLFPGLVISETTLGPGGIVDLNYHDVRHLQVLRVTPGRWMSGEAKELDLWSRRTHGPTLQVRVRRENGRCAFVVDDELDDSVEVRAACPREVFGASAVVSVE